MRQADETCSDAPGSLVLSHAGIHELLPLLLLSSSPATDEACLRWPAASSSAVECSLWP